MATWVPPQQTQMKSKKALFGEGGDRDGGGDSTGVNFGMYLAGPVLVCRFTWLELGDWVGMIWRLDDRCCVVGELCARVCS